MHFCVFSMQIGDYRAYATILRNEFSENDQDLRNNPTETTMIVVNEYFPGCTDLWWVDCQSDDLEFPFLCSFVFWFMFSAIVKIYRYFWDRNILWAKSPPISGRTVDLLRTIFGKFCVFLSITCQKTGLEGFSKCGPVSASASFNCYNGTVTSQPRRVRSTL